jgi:hypothetical protein
MILLDALTGILRGALLIVPVRSFNLIVRPLSTVRPKLNRLTLTSSSVTLVTVVSRRTFRTSSLGLALSLTLKRPGAAHR